MRLATIRTSDGIRAARVEGDHAVLLGHSDVGALLAEGPHALADAAQVTGPTFEVATLDYAPLVPNPGKVFCLAEAPSADAVKRIHARAGHPTEQVYEVPLKV